MTLAPSWTLLLGVAPVGRLSGGAGVFERDYDTRPGNHGHFTGWGGRVTIDTSPDGIREYSYDAPGRLVTVADKDPGGVLVETRAYGFDANTNRTSLSITPAGGTAATVTYTYDAADRLLEVVGGPNPGPFAYDANGNTVTMPGVSLTWTGNNRVRTITTASATVTYELDPVGRTRTRSDGTTESLHHYGGDADSPSWVLDGATTTRYVPGPAGLSAAHVTGGQVTWLLTTPHGALWAHADSAGELTATFTFDEYGVPQGPATGWDLGLGRYQWLGRQQRETDPESGLILMGVRVYAPTLGRFLSVDPIHGGSANDYDYVAADPTNNYDLDGKFCVLGRNPDGSCRGGRVARAAGRAAREAGPVLQRTACTIRTLMNPFGPPIPPRAPGLFYSGMTLAASAAAGIKWAFAGGALGGPGGVAVGMLVGIAAFGLGMAIKGVVMTYRSC